MSEARYPYVHVLVPDHVVDEVSAELFAAGVMGVEERDRSTLSDGSDDAAEWLALGVPETDLKERTLLVAAVQHEDEAWMWVHRLRDRYPARVGVVVGDDWRDAWKQYFKATRIGTRLCVAPSWEDMALKQGDVLLRMDPGRAFGSGTHETTRLVMRELDRVIAGGERVLDVGAGSGILSIAALLLGAESACAVDNDTDTFPVALENAERNQVAGRFSVAGDSLNELTETYDVVLANIQTSVLLPMAAAIISRVSGVLILSGILSDEALRVQAGYAALGEPLVTRENEWVALTYEKANV